MQHDYLRCTKSEVDDRVRKHFIRHTKKRASRFLILEQMALQLPYIFLKFYINQLSNQFLLFLLLYLLFFYIWFMYLKFIWVESNFHVIPTWKWFQFAIFFYLPVYEWLFILSQWLKRHKGPHIGCYICQVVNLFTIKGNSFQRKHKVITTTFLFTAAFCL